MVTLAQLRWPDSDPLSRHVYLVVLDRMTWPKSLSSDSDHFALLLAFDATGTSNEEVSSFAKSAIEAGMVSCVTWGAGCERVHDIVDAAVVELLESQQPNPSRWDFTVMTTWHDEETLDEVLQFMDVCPVIDEHFESTCSTWYIFAIANAEWAEAVRRYFAQKDLRS